uniref:Putative structural protein n=1 Tax=viral metagenome TaxID=1070528 RepID=A0A6M3KV58_9ZZZZ
MATNHYSGKAGSVLAPGVIAGIKSWNLEYTVDILETTDFADSGVATYIPGVTRWSGSFDGFKDGVPIAGLHTEVALKLYETQTVDERWEGQAIITAVRANVDHDGIVSYSYDFQGTAGLTVAAA